MSNSKWDRLIGPAQPVGAGGGATEHRPPRLMDLVRRADEERQERPASAGSAQPDVWSEAAAELAGELAALHAGDGDPAALLEAFRCTAVLVPVMEDGDGLWSARLGGIRWLYAFSDEVAFARFAAALGALPASDWEYVRVLGSRLLDVAVPAVGEPAGVALDVGSERPMMFPPVVGIVPEEAAVDAAQGGKGLR